MSEHYLLNYLTITQKKIVKYITFRMFSIKTNNSRYLAQVLKYYTTLQAVYIVFSIKSILKDLLNHQLKQNRNVIIKYEL